jgi:dGTP triphosphohydrolase
LTPFKIIIQTFLQHSCASSMKQRACLLREAVQQAQISSADPPQLLAELQCRIAEAVAEADDLWQTIQDAQEVLRTRLRKHAECEAKAVLPWQAKIRAYSAFQLVTELAAERLSQAQNAAKVIQRFWRETKKETC